MQLLFVLVPLAAAVAGPLVPPFVVAVKTPRVAVVELLAAGEVAPLLVAVPTTRVAKCVSNESRARRNTGCRKLTFWRSFSCCSVSLFRIAAILAPLVGTTEGVEGVAGTVGPDVGDLIAGVGSDLDVTMGPRAGFTGVSSFNSLAVFLVALPMVIGMTEARADFLLFFSFEPPFELV